MDMHLPDVEYDGGVFVTLSQRNLVDLTKQMQVFGFAELHRMTPNGFLRVVVEKDADHYGDRTPGPGGLADI